MQKLTMAAHAACACVGLVLANPPKAPSRSPSDVDTVRQLERDLGDALVAADLDKLNRMFADDWESIGLSGKISTKASVLADIKSGKDKLLSFELGPMDVQVVGNVAVGHGSVTEKRSCGGKDNSGEFVWMDLLEKRADRWVIVRSAGARVKRESLSSGRSPFWPAWALL